MSYKRAEEAKEVTIFHTDSDKFPTQEIIGAQNFNFAPKFPRNMDFLP